MSTPDLSAQSNHQVLPCHGDRLNELRLLKLKLGESRRELHILKNSVANIDILKHEVHCLGRELLQERTKVKALSEELENPLNVHRYANMCLRMEPATWHRNKHLFSYQWTRNVLEYAPCLLKRWVGLQHTVQRRGRGAEEGGFVATGTYRLP